MDTDTTNHTPVNPLLASLRIPGETFRLPSQGLFYKSGELDDSVSNGELEVYPMTAMDEVILSTPDKLMSGKAILEIFENCIPQIKKPGDLLSLDVDFLIACLRMVSFGQFMEVLFTHGCEGAKAHTYSIDIQKMINSTRSIDATRLNDEYTHVLENNQVAKLKPMTYLDVVKLFQSQAMMKVDNITEAEAHQLIVEALAGVIQSVDGITDKAFIIEWVSKLPWNWKRSLEKAAQSISKWGTEFVSTHTCKDCGEDMDIHVSANPVSFFM